MTESEIKQAIARLDAMSDRCEHLISKNKPLTLDEPPKRAQRPSPTVVRSEGAPCAEWPRHAAPIVSGQLSGNEMTGYRAHKTPRIVDDVGDGSIDSIFAAFEAEFDEMAQAHRKH